MAFLLHLFIISDSFNVSGGAVVRNCGTLRKHAYSNVL